MPEWIRRILELRERRVSPSGCMDCNKEWKLNEREKSKPRSRGKRGRFVVDEKPDLHPQDLIHEYPIVRSLTLIKNFLIPTKYVI